MEGFSANLLVSRRLLTHQQEICDIPNANSPLWFAELLSILDISGVKVVQVWLAETMFSRCLPTGLCGLHLISGIWSFILFHLPALFCCEYSSASLPKVNRNSNKSTVGTLVQYASHSKHFQPSGTRTLVTVTTPPTAPPTLLQAEQLFPNSPAKHLLRARCNATVMWHLLNIQRTDLNKAREGLGFGHGERMCQWVTAMKIFRPHHEAELKLNSRTSQNVSLETPRQTLFPECNHYSQNS